MTEPTAAFDTFARPKVLPLTRVLVSVTNDLSSDQRVDRVCRSLTEMGFEVTLIGRKLKNSSPLDSRPYKTKRFKLPFEKGPLFYATFNIRLFFELIFRKSQVLLSNDLDTLLANYLANGLKRNSLVYDSHEYFTGVPELENREKVRNVWKRIEKWILPKLKHCYTVNPSISNLYRKEYGTEFEVVKNVPDAKSVERKSSKKDLNLPEDKKILILQGAGINVERGAEELVESMHHLSDVLLLIVGSGDVLPQLKEKVKAEGLTEKVRFIGKLPYEEMFQYTFNSDLGFSLDKGESLNYRYSLPNKLFDYILAGIPVITSALPEVEKIVKGYKIGETIPDHHPETIANKIKEVLSNEQRIRSYKANAATAAQEFTWSTEREKLEKIFAQFQ